MVDAPKRRVVILRDTASPLHYLQCAEPCQAAGWCMRGPDGKHEPHCYLGGCLSDEGARVMAERAGYEVVA